jgi:hypothetical protein
MVMAKGLGLVICLAESACSRPLYFVMENMVQSFHMLKLNRISEHVQLSVFEVEKQR